MNQARQYVGLNPIPETQGLGIQPEPIRQIPEQISNLDSAITSMQFEVTELIRHLRPCILDPVGKAQQSEPPNGPVLCDMAAMIAEKAYRVDGLANAIRELRGMIQL